MPQTLTSPATLVRSKVTKPVVTTLKLLPLWNGPQALATQADRYHGPIWRVATWTTQGEVLDYVCADTPEEALQLLADYGMAYARKQRPRRPGLSYAYASDKLIQRFALEPDELLPLGSAQRPHIHGLILSITPMMGWEMPADTLFTSER